MVKVLFQVSMMAKRVLFLFILLCAVGAAAVPSWAQRRDYRLRSSDDLVKEFQVLHNSVDRLVQANVEWAEHNRVLQQNIQELQRRRQAAGKDGELLVKDLADWEEKIKSKAAMGRAKVKEDEIKDRLVNANQEIAMKKEQLKAGQEEQQRVWERLAVAGTSEGQSQNARNLQEYINEKKKLDRRLKDSIVQKERLEQRLDYLKLLNADSSLSVPKLMAKRDMLKSRRDILSGQSSKNPRNPVSYRDLSSQERFKKLDFEVKKLAQKHLENSKLLQTIENQYNSDPSVSHSGDEKKIQESIGKLRNENKLLKAQLANLRFEMVSLDKKKAQLEQEVKPAKVI